jgi:hypothetical protein
MAYTTIDKSTDYFNTVLYAGNGSSNAITGVGFQPDWIWLKNRSTNNSHQLYDAVRGTTKYLESDNADSEYTSSDGISAFGSDGFTIAGNLTGANNSSNNFVSWNWLGANGTASNSNGSITSTVSANTTSGFSIVSYTGTLGNATVGHGLGVAPKVIFIKCRGTGARSWVVYHDSIGNTKHLTLSETDAAATSSASFNNTSPTSSVFSLGTSNNANDSTTMIAYCFAEKKGFSRFSSYVGNGSSDGSFIYLGFKPAWFMLKSISGEGWNMYDNKRLGYNERNDQILANTNGAEQDTSAWRLDLLSNGVKIRGNDSGVNGSGTTYIYMAFAENPFVTSTGIPTTAR